uniref:Transposase n=1 Tax=Globodera rostochiensis TaxID=31243 RepID=A0A914HSE2_GLORO
MSITKTTGRTPKLDKLNPIQLIRILLSQNKTVAKELGLCFKTIYKWKRKLGQTKPKHKYSDSEQMELMKQYYEIKNQNPRIKDKDIAKMLKIGTRTLCNWKNQFKRQQIYQNSVDGHSVEENAAALESI